MKNELIKMLIEEEGKRAYYESQWKSHFFFDGKWKALWHQSNEKIGVIKEQLKKI